MSRWVNHSNESCRARMHSSRLSNIGRMVFGDISVLQHHAPYITQAPAMHASTLLWVFSNTNLKFILTFLRHFQVYQGPKTKFQYESLASSTEIRFRVCAVRLMNAPNQSSSPIKGVFSSVTSARTMTPRKKKISESSAADDDQEPEVKQTTRISLTDKQWAMIFFLGFSLLAVVVVLLLPSLFGVSD